MGKLMEQTKNAGMNSGAIKMAKMVRLKDIKKHPEIESIFIIQPRILEAIKISMQENGIC
jgi:hypothetical protein